MPKEKEKTLLQETKGKFKFVGKVARLDKDGAFKEEEQENGKNAGRKYRSLRFGVKTSGTNEMTVQMFDYEPKEVFLWNTEKAKAEKAKGGKYKGERVSFDTWMEKKETLREKGYSVLQSRIGLAYDDKDKLISHGVPSFVASKMLYDGLENGDSVVVEGKIRYSTYKDKEGKERKQVNYTVENVIKLRKEIDFEAEKFEEVTYFEQPMVFVDSTHEKKDKKVHVVGRAIDFAGNFEDATFTVDYNGFNENDEDEGMKKLALAFEKKFSFGDILSVYGEALNRVIVEETQEEDDSEDDLLASLGGRKKPSHAQQFVSRTYISEMQIQGIEAWDKKIYKEEDFIKDELVDDSDSELEDFGGKKKKENPFADDPFSSGASIDLDDDDLPF